MPETPSPCTFVPNSESLNLNPQLMGCVARAADPAGRRVRCSARGESCAFVLEPWAVDLEARVQLWFKNQSLGSRAQCVWDGNQMISIPARHSFSSKLDTDAERGFRLYLKPKAPK